MKKELIILGATGNLGRSVIDSFPLSDYDRIFLAGRNTAKISDRTGSYEIIQTGDFSDEDSIRNVFRRFEPGKDKLFFLFSTAGGYFGGKNLWETEEKNFRAMLETNLVSSFFILKYFSLLVEKSGGGSICLTSAMTSLKAEKGKSAYGASKCAMNYLVKTLAEEGRQIGLAVNAVAPFIIDSEENREWVKDRSTLVSPEDIGRIVYDLFKNFTVTTGNIIEVPFTLNKVQY
ncbi:MAG: SDR family NAD(P)-dependent oxidoreductase [Syntrophothermus sp.]